MRARRSLPAEVLGQVARMFQVLGDESRLEILQVLMAGPKTVSALVVASGKGQANVSKHLGILAAAGILGRTKKGTQVIYEVREPMVYELCDLVCGSIRRRLEDAANLHSGLS